MTPPNEVESPLPPVVSLPEPSAILPAPAIEPVVAENPPRLNVAPELTMTAELVGTALAAPSVSVPAEIVVAPV
jgi:hypothetical protein